MFGKCEVIRVCLVGVGFPNADAVKTDFAFVLCRKFCEMRDACFAWAAPGCPELNNVDFAFFELGERGAFEPLGYFDWWRGVTDAESGLSGGGADERGSGKQKEWK